jgi:hypothetical protein
MSTSIFPIRRMVDLQTIASSELRRAIMAGHRFSIQSTRRRFLRILAPLAAGVALLALPQQAWGVYKFTVSNNSFSSMTVGSSTQQTVTVTYNGPGSVAITSIVLQSVGSGVQSVGVGHQEYVLGSTTSCTGAPISTSCSFSVTYAPAYPGSLASPALSRNATLVLTDGNSNTWTFGLAGAATGAIGQVVPGTITVYAGLPYTNTGNPPLPQDNGLGNSQSGYTADGVPAASTKIDVSIASYSGQTMAIDSAGNLYFVDSDDSIIRKIDNTTNHFVTTVAGTPKTAGSTGTSGEGGLATAAKLTTPYSMALDSAGDIYFTNYGGQDNSGAHYFVLRRVDAITGILSSVAGQNFNGSTYTGSGTCPTSNPTSWQCGDGGQAADAELKGVTNFVIDGSGNIYIWEGLGGYLREINASTGIITTVATAAQLNVNPTNNSNGGITLAADGNIYIVVMDQTTGYAAIREYNTSTQAITPLAGNISCSTAGTVTTPSTIQGGFLLNKLFVSGISPLSSDTSGNLYLTTHDCDPNNSPTVYRINLNSQMAYPLMYDYSEWEIEDTGALAGAFNAFYGYYVNPTFAIPDNAGNLYFFNWYGQIGLLSGSNAELSYPFVFPPNTPLPQYDFTTSADQIVTYANVGNANQPIPAYSLAAGANFTVDTNPPNNAAYCITANTLVTGTTCNIYLQFTPTAVGAVSDTLNIGSPASQTVTLNGTGEANSELQFSQQAINFGNQAINTTSAAQTITVSNPGTAALTFFYTLSGLNSGYFTITPGTCVVDTMGNYDVAVSSSCTLQVTYKPKVIESDSAAIQFNSNINGGINTGTQVSLAGAGTAAVVQPVATLLPSPLGFPSTASGATAKLTTTLSQTAASATLTISGITITGTNAANFTIDSSSSCNGVANIVGVNSCTIVVDFKPTAAASYSATLNVADNATPSTQTVPLSGTGTAALTAQTIIFNNPGTQTVGSPLTLTATATSSLPVAYTSTTTSVCTVSGTQATFLIAGNCTIDANQAGNSTYGVAPMVPQSFTVNAAPATAPAVNLNPSPLVVTPIGVLQRGVSFITLTNNGTATLSNIAFNLSGAYASFFAIDAYTGAQGETAGTCTGVTSLTAGLSCTIQVAFQSSTPGKFSAILSVSDNASNSPQTVTVTGTATLGQLQFYPALLNTYAGVIGLGSGCQDTGNGGPAVNALLCHAESTAADLNGNVYISDAGMNVVRKVDASGNISDFAGNASESGASGPGCAQQTNGIGDGCPAADATIGSPAGVAVDGFGNVYIADSGNKSIRVVNGQTGIITTFLGTVNGSLTIGSTNFNFIPGGLTFDPSGNLYVTDYIAAVVLKVDTSGNYTISAGVLTQQGYNGDNQPATSAKLYFPTGVAADLYGNVYIADSGNNRIRKVDTSGNITTVAGTGTEGNSGDGGPAIAAEIYAGGVAVDVAGEFYFSTDGTSIRKVDLLGNITTIAGGGSGSTGGPAPSAHLFDAVNPGIDLAGDVLIPSDSGVAKAGPQGALVFGSTNVGSTSLAQTVTLINTGSSTLYFYSPSQNLALPGTPGRAAATAGARGGAAVSEGTGSSGSVWTVIGDFAVATGGTCNLTPSGSIAAGASCTVNVTFTPTQPGSRTGTLNLDVEDSNEILSNTSVQLTGTGTSAATVATPQISPPTGAYSNYQTVTITDATPNAVICYTTTSGSTPAASNGVCTTGSTYTGSFSMGAGLNIQAIGTLSGDTNSGLATATYTLQAAAPTLLPPGGTYVGAQSVTLSTTTTGAAIWYTTNGTTPTGTTPSIHYNSSTPIAVTTSGTVINAITIDDGMQNSTVTTGTYTLQFPAVSLTAPSAFTGTTGTTSAAQTATLQNTGTAPLTNIVISLTGSNPSDFAITTGTNACGTTLAAGASCSIYITFTPAAASSFTATLSVADNAANTPQTAALSGTGAALLVPSFTVTSPTAPQTVQPGGAAIYTINVNPVNGSYTGAVTLSVVQSTLPAGARASFSSNPVTPGSAGTTSTLTIQTATQTASGKSSVWPMAVPALSLIGLFFVPGKRRRWLTLGVMLFASLGALTALSGCGGGFPLPKAASTLYSITVNGANSSGVIVSFTTVQLTVQ